MVYKNVSFNFDLMYINILKVINSFVQRKNLWPFNILLHTKALTKLIGNWFCTQIIFKNSEICCLHTFCVRCVWIVTGYFLFEKQALFGLLGIGYLYSKEF